MKLIAVLAVALSFVTASWAATLKGNNGNLPRHWEIGFLDEKGYIQSMCQTPVLVSFSELTITCGFATGQITACVEGEGRLPGWRIAVPDGILGWRTICDNPTVDRNQSAIHC